VLNQFARRAVAMHLFQALHSTIPVQPEVLPPGRFQDVTEFSDLRVGQTMALQKQHFHPTLHQRHRVMKPFVIERADNFRDEL